MSNNALGCSLRWVAICYIYIYIYSCVLTFKHLLYNFVIWLTQRGYHTSKLCNSLQLQAFFLTQCILMLARCPEILKHVKTGNIQNLLAASACIGLLSWKCLKCYLYFGLL